MFLDDRLGDRQADATTAAGPAPGRIYSVEPFEEMREMLCGNAFTGVRDGDDDLTLARADADVDPPALGGVTQGVVQQIAQHLPEPLRVHPQRTDRGIDVRAKLHTRGVRAVGPGRQRRGHQRPGVHPLRGQALPLFGLGQRPDVLGQPDQPPGLIPHHRHRVAVERLDTVFECLDVGLQHRDGGADLVRQVAEQPAAGRLHVFQPCRHGVEGPGERVEVGAEVRRRDPGVEAAVGDPGRRGGDLGQRALQAPADVPGDHQRGQCGGRDRDGHGDRGRVGIGLLGVELLV
ncbi:hypothetical protein MSZK_17690 [Mycobacterium sp. shizuoka-1]|nr:hypothetical protein MSZK_17690 [Mycobacterium sp. shizuoka-1]